MTTEPSSATPADADLVERAKRWSINTGYVGNPDSVPMRLITELQSLRAENGAFRALLAECADDLALTVRFMKSRGENYGTISRLERRVRAALKETRNG